MELQSISSPSQINVEVLKKEIAASKLQLQILSNFDDKLRGSLAYNIRLDLIINNRNAILQIPVIAFAEE
jgi:hypothetical protein